MGKLILLIAIGFALYWGWKFMTGTKKKKEEKLNDNIDDLVHYYQTKIDIIECQSIAEIKKQEDKLNYYKEQLNKINQIKTNQK